MDGRRANEFYINMLWSFYAQKHFWVLSESFFRSMMNYVYDLLFAFTFLRPKRR